MNLSDAEVQMRRARINEILGEKSEEYWALIRQWSKHALPEHMLHTEVLKIFDDDVEGFMLHNELFDALKVRLAKTCTEAVQNKEQGKSVVFAKFLIAMGSEFDGISQGAVDLTFSAAGALLNNLMADILNYSQTCRDAGTSRSVEQQKANEQITLEQIYEVLRSKQYTDQDNSLYAMMREWISIKLSDDSSSNVDDDE